MNDSKWHCVKMNRWQLMASTNQSDDTGEMAMTLWVGGFVSFSSQQFVDSAESGVDRAGLRISKISSQFPALQGRTPGNARLGHHVHFQVSKLYFSSIVYLQFYAKVSSFSPLTALALTTISPTPPLQISRMGTRPRSNEFPYMLLALNLSQVFLFRHFRYHVWAHVYAATNFLTCC